MEYNQSTSLLQTRNTTEELELTVTNLEEAKPTLFAIRKSRSLKRLLLASSGHDKEVLAVCRFALEGSYALEALTLEFVNCSDEGIHNVVIALKTIVKLASVTFRLNNVTHVGAGAIADLLESKNLDRFSIHGTQMDLHDLCIGDAGALCIAMSTQKCLTLKHLTISHCGLTDMGVAQIMPYLELHPSLSSLDLSGNAISKKGVSIIFHLLPQLSRIKELILDNNRIGNAAFDQLSPSATSHTHSLKTLSVKSCSITKDSIMLLIKGIEELDVLNLGGNNDIGNDGAYLLSKHLRKDRSLKSLDLSSCGIEDEGCVCISDSLVSNSSLLQLCLHRNYIGDSGIVALATALQTNRTLQGLVVSENRFGEQGTTGLLNCLSENTTLTHVTLSTPTQLHTHIQTAIELLLAKNEQIERLKTAMKKVKQENASLRTEKDRLQWALGNSL